MHGLIRIGVVAYDRQRSELRGSTRSERLDDKSAAVLECLIARCDLALTVDEILAAAWPGVTVSPVNVGQHIFKIRTAFREIGGGDPIKTFKAPARYRLCQDVAVLQPIPDAMIAARQGQGQATADAGIGATAVAEPRDEAIEIEGSRLLKWQGPLPHELAGPPADATHLAQPAPLPMRLPRRAVGATARWAAVALLALLCVGAIWRSSWFPAARAPRLSIVVLPLVAEGDDVPTRMLASAITDDLTIDLGHIPQSTVIARPSADSIARRNLPLPEIGRLLHVRYILSGSLYLDGPAYRVAVQLNDAGSGAVLWGTKFVFEKAEAGIAREAIEGKLANAMNFQIDLLETTRSRNDRPDDPDAEDLFRQARSLLNSTESMESFDQAAVLLRHAIALNHDFGDALAELGWVILRKHWLYTADYRTTELSEAHDAIAASRRLSPSNASALAAEALEYETHLQCPEATHLASEALEIESNSSKALSVLIGCAWWTADLDGISRYLNILDRVDPFGERKIKRLVMHADVDLMRAQPGRAVGELRDAIADARQPALGDPPMDVPEDARILLLAAYVRAGEISAAQDDYRKFSVVYPNRSIWRVVANLPPKIVEKYRAAGILAALHTAGLPYYAEDAAIPVGDCSTDKGEFAAAPGVLARGRLLDAKALAGLLKGATVPVIIDTGPGAAKPATAIWAPHDSDPEKVGAYVDKMLDQSPPLSRRAEVVVMGAGIFGCDGFLAVQHMQQAGYTSVDWLRGGEESWARSFQQSLQ